MLTARCATIRSASRVGVAAGRPNFQVPSFNPPPLLKFHGVRSMVPWRRSVDGAARMHTALTAPQAKMPDFSSTETAYAAKSNAELIRSWLVFKLCGWRWLVNNSSYLVDLSYSVRLLYFCHEYSQGAQRSALACAMAFTCRYLENG